MPKLGFAGRAPLFVSAALIALVGAGAAQAQDTPAQGSASAANPTTDDNAIVVTAQRRAQILAEVPQAVSNIGEETLQRQNARSFQDYAALVPGLTLTQENPGETRLIIRGVNTGGVSATVATYVDDTPFGASGAQSNSGILAGDFDTFDVARIEVLRGPQGTLYGTNSLGGVLKFVTALPSVDAFELRAQAGIEDTRYGEIGYSGNLLVNVPISDTLAFRASGFYRSNGGYIDAPSRGARNVNQSDSYGARASLLFTPNEDLSIRLFGLFQNIDSNSPTNFVVRPATLQPMDPVTGVALGEADRRRYERIAEFNQLDYRLYAATIDHDFGFATLTSVTSYSTQYRNELSDESTTESFRGLANLLYALAAPATVGAAFENDVDVDKFTQEIRLQSPDSDSFEWQIGGYYTDENTALIQEILPFTLATQQFIPPATTVPVFFGPPFGGNVISNFVTSGIDASYEEIAIFGSATLKLGDRFDITAGARYSHNQQETTQAVIQLGVGTPQFGDSSEGVFTWSVAPRFEFSDYTSVYGRVAKGYRPGGPNFIPAGAPATFPTEYNSDTIISYEFGLRTQTPDNRFSLDAALFYLDWNDIQILSSTLVNGTPVGVNTNGRRARSVGAEFSATLRPLRGLTLVANAAFVNAELRDDTIPPGGGLNLTGGLAGDSLPYTPEISANLSADYEWALGANATAFVGANIRLVGDQTGGFSAAYRTAFGRRIELDGYETVDLRAGADFGRFSVQVYARNLFDTAGLVSAGDFPSVVNAALGGTSIQHMSASTIRPRTVGLIVGFEY